MKNPPANPIIQFSPEDEKKLEENVDNMTMVHVHRFVISFISSIVISHM